MAATTAGTARVASAQQQLRDFHRAFELALDEYQPPRHLLALRKRLIREESEEVGAEFDEALYKKYLSDDLRVKLTKELADLAYVVYGAAVSFGIDLDMAIDVVHESNMSKLGEDGKPIKDEGGKALKGPNYRPPDARRLARAAGVAIEGEADDGVWLAP